MWPFILIASLESLNYKHTEVLAQQRSMREKPPDNAENRENGVWREAKFSSLAENAAQTRRWTTFSNIYVPDDRISRIQVLGLVTSQAT